MYRRNVSDVRRAQEKALVAAGRKHSRCNASGLPFAGVEGNVPSGVARGGLLAHEVPQVRDRPKRTEVQVDKTYCQERIELAGQAK